MKVFIVYALRDKTNLKRVRDILIELGVEPVVLDDLPPSGTIFDKLVSNAKRCDKAVVLYSGVDVGGAFVKDPKKPVLVRRARENVLLELGLFIGMLRIKNVLILLNKNINRPNLPSDLSGLETKPLSSSYKTLKKNISSFINSKEWIWNL